MMQVYLCGPQELIAQIEADLQDLEIDLRPRVGPPYALARMDRHASACILAARSADSAMIAACRSHASAPGTANVPLIAILPDRTTQATIRRFYQEGVTAVFLWPLERESFPRVLVNLLRVGVHTHPSRSDLALASAIEARLAADGTTARSGLRVAVVDGVAFVSGTVNALWKKQVVEDLIAETPGVEGVVFRQMSVQDVSASDARIARGIRNLLRSAVGVESSTLAVAVRNGAVTLTGTVGNVGEVRRVMDLVPHVQGVREVVDRTIRSLQRKMRDASVARMLHRTIRITLGVRAWRVDIGFYGGVAVLRGTVRDLRTKLEAGRLLLRHSSVYRVVNKIEVQ